MAKGEKTPWARWSALGLLICVIPDFSNLESDTHFVVSIDKRGQWKSASGRMSFGDAKKHRAVLYRHHRQLAAADRKARRKGKK